MTKGLSREPIKGNPRPAPLAHGGRHDQLRRPAECRRPALSSARNCRSFASYSVPVFANVFGYRVEDYLEVIRALEDRTASLVMS